MMSSDLQELGRQLNRIESIALIPRVGSTLDLATRVVAECIENELPIPSAMILAREQYAGRGRGERSWHSPSERGIYATMTFTVPRPTAGLLPLSFAVATAQFLRSTWGIDAALKWPNDVLVDDEKIAGILISARHQGELAHVAAGVGINVRHLEVAPPKSTSVEDLIGQTVDLDRASIEFVRWFDREFDPLKSAAEILGDWRELTVHEQGDPIRCLVGNYVVSGEWAGIDESGRAVLDRDGGSERIASGDLIDWK